MRKLVFAIVGVFALLAVIMVAFMIFVINRGNGYKNINNIELKLVNTKQVKIDDIDYINIKFYSDNVEFLSSNSDELIVKEYKSYEPNTDELATVATSGDQLLIHGKQIKFKFNPFSFKKHYSRVEIYLPVKYGKDLSVSTSSGNISSDLVIKMKEIKASCSSGDIRFNEIEADDITVSSSSGNITMQRAEGIRHVSSSSGCIKILGGNGDSKVESSSGNIYIDKTLGKLSANSSSGDIKINDAVGNMEVCTSSGTINIDRSSGEINASSTSGDIKILALDGGGVLETSSGGISYDIQKLTSPISMKASSGDIKLKVPEVAVFDFEANSSSGQIKTNFNDYITIDKDKKHANGTVGENSSNHIQISTSSGNISVTRN